MIEGIRQRFPALSDQQWLFGLWGFLLLFFFTVGVVKEWYFLVFAPLVLLLAIWTLVDPKNVFFLLMACVPISTEVVLPNGFGTDLPTEPLTVWLMLVALALFLWRLPRLQGFPLTHPISLLLVAHVGWIFISTLQSESLLISVKFLLAKIWYVAVFYFFAIQLIRDEKDVLRMVWWIFWPLVFSVAVIMARHAGYGFSFDQVHKVLHPFQRNHVSYAGTLAVFMPLLWYLISGVRRFSWKWMGLVVVFGWLLIAVYLTYTRAAYVALGLALGAYFIFRLRMIRVVLVGGVLGVVLLAGYMLVGNRYLQYAPNYDTTVTHNEFSSLIEATAKGEDISTMERVYRWVAATQMSRAEPVFGFGPGNFVTFYQSYSVNSFRTYVSRNEEKSGVHSYFLLLLVEQGWPGLILFLSLSLWVLAHGEDVYHRTQDPGRKRAVMTVLLALVVIYAFLIINDMIETDKMGSFFFVSLAILVRMDELNRKEALSGKTDPRDDGGEPQQHAQPGVGGQSS
ncbi:MAG: O-antigen ligase family protein [Haliscomenobacter sp.]|nr:O-antigen ligase family protein [Haliscomenobacter sp.]MBK8655056.1 O-antigen ligase family protein [Haliscomenobacter sp.]MBP9075462.1 O-antigen ligase family protein [Haliscomenobacter sp.]